MKVMTKNNNDMFHITWRNSDSVYWEGETFSQIEILGYFDFKTI